MSRGLAVALCLACAVAIACSAARTGAPRTTAAPEPGQAAEVPGDPRAEIEALDRAIAGELARAHLAPPAAPACSGAACTDALAQPFVTPAVGDPSCHPAPGERCGDVCTLSTSICRDQQRICDLARQLAGDEWAANKCTGARASCQAAHDSCCSCVL